jgi:hypothetical protein
VVGASAAVRRLILKTRGRDNAGTPRGATRQLPVLQFQAITDTHEVQRTQHKQGEPVTRNPPVGIITRRSFVPLNSLGPERLRCTGSPDHEEEKMRLITHFELAARNKAELHGMLRQAFNALANNEPDSQEYRNALGSIENIQRKLEMG